MTQKTVIGIFDSANEAQQALERLTERGFTRDNIDLSVHGAYNDSSYRSPSGSTTSEDHDDDGLGERISRFFSSLFDSDEDTNRYSTVARKGAMLTLQAQDADEAERAADIMDECGAVNVDERAREYGNQYNSGSSYTDNTYMGGTSSTVSQDNLAETGSILSNDNDISSRRSMVDDTVGEYDTTRDREDYDSTRDRNSDDRNSIPVIEEELQVGKREIQTGGVRVRSRIIEKPVEESLRLREEHVRVERNPVNRPATEAELSNFRETEIEMRERAEVPVVNKDVRVVEEVNLNREVTEREETIRDRVRKTDVDVEQLNSTEDTISSSKRPRKKNDDLDI